MRKLTTQWAESSRRPGRGMRADPAPVGDSPYPVITPVAPVVSSAIVADATPAVIALTFSKVMNTAVLPAASAFTVSAGHTVTGVAWGSNTVLAVTVTPDFVNGEAARTLTYAQPATNKIVDAQGQLLAAFAARSITNNVQPDAVQLRRLRWRTGADAKSRGWGDASWEDNAAQYRMVYTGVYGLYVDANGNSTLATTMRTRRNNIRAKSECDTLVGNYVIDYEIQDWEDNTIDPNTNQPKSGQARFPGFKQVSQWVKSLNAWLRKTAAAGGGFVAWTNAYWGKNINTYAEKSAQVKDAAGDAAPEAIAKIYFDWYFKTTQLDWVFHDNSITQNLGDETTANINYLLDGVAHRATDAVVQTGFYRNQVRKLDRYDELCDAAGRPRLLHVGNIGNAAFSQWNNNIIGAAAPGGARWDGANMEGGFGIFWSADSQWGWNTWFSRTKTILDNLREPKLLSVVNTVYNTVDHQQLMYGFASCLLFPKVLYFTHVESLGAAQHSWYQLDEYLIRLGDVPSGAIPTGPTQNGIWTQTYPGGMVLVNPNENKGRRLRGVTLTRTNNVVRLTGWANHTVTVGEVIRIVHNYNAPSFNGQFPVTAVNASAGWIEWADAGANETIAGGYGALSRKSTIDLTGQGYRFYGAAGDAKIGATWQRPDINTGAPCGVVTMWSNDGIIVVRQDYRP